MERLKVMIVEDEVIVAEDIRQHLENMGYRITSIHGDGAEALAAVHRDPPDVVLMDIKLQGGTDGIEAARRIRSEADRPVVFLTSYSDDGILEKAKEVEPYGYLLKPFDDRELHTTIQMAIHKHRMEQLVRSAKREWERTFDTIPDGVAVIDREFRILRANRALAEALGRRPGELVGRRCYEAIEDRREPPQDCPYRRLLADGGAHGCEMRIDRLGGVYDVTVNPLTDAEGRLIGAVHVSRDVTARWEAEAALARSRAFLQTVIDGVADAVVVIGTDYRVRMMNRAARQWVGCGTEEPLFCHAVGHGLASPCEGRDHPCPLQQVRATAGPVVVTHRHRRGDQGFFPVEIVATPLLGPDGAVEGVIEVARDVSERERVEEERRELTLRRAEARRNESVLTLAGGIAHEFNNILTTVLGSSELLRDRWRSPSEREALLDAITGSGQRMAELTRELLAYAGGGKFRPERIRLEALVSRALDRALQGRQDASIQVEMRAAPGLRHVHGDVGQMQQVFDHLFSNAVEAMEEKGGRLQVVLENETHAAEWVCVEGETHPPGAYLRITVRDEGVGIPREFKGRIFDPFFSTKFMGRGLGLAAVRGIVRGHGGCISVQSTPGRGTSVVVCLPAVTEGPVGFPTVSVSGKRPLGRKILVVDDEPEILSLVQDVLRQGGYEVIGAADGLQAIRILEKEAGAIGLVFLDVHMPATDGRQVFRKIRSLQPDLPVFVMSGYGEATALSGIRLGPNDAYIPKPFPLDQLLERVRSRLGTPPFSD